MQTLISSIITSIRKQRPLILNLTNSVSQEFIANGLLSLGATPLMSDAIDEAEDLVKLASGVVINTGTLNPNFLDLCKNACHHANQYNKVLTLDPVGCGASQLRLHANRQLLQTYRWHCIKGNASEIMALIDESQHSHGVDTNHETGAALTHARLLAKQYHTIITISGELDYIVDANQQTKNQHGAAVMAQVSASGCLLTAIITAFITCHDNVFEATGAAVAYYTLCGENAAKKSTLPGSFKMHFIDELAKFN